MKESEKTENCIDAKVIIQKVLDALDMKAPTFAEQVGVSYMRIFDLQRGRTKKFNPNMVQSICNRFPQISKNFLYTGEGPLFIEDEKPELPKKPAQKELFSPEAAQPTVERVLSLLEKLQQKDEYITEKMQKLQEWERELMQREIDLAKRENDLSLREQLLSLKK